MRLEDTYIMYSILIPIAIAVAIAISIYKT